MRLAFFGGSFDPPHRGHLAIATAAIRHLSLDRVLFAPTGKQPLKRAGASASFADRLAMVDLLCGSESALAASGIDAPHADGSPNYTVDALKHLRQQDPKVELFSIVGADNLVELPRWREANRLFELATWIAVSRPGSRLLVDLAPALRVQRDIGRLHLISDVEVAVSSTELRHRLCRGEECGDAIPPNILYYIRGHDLYSPRAPDCA